ncbi:MAG: hypothetical protein QOC72_3206, partial [Methylobacteriaceae bacterium]|nr:hypothetical protein [Methylobacteriaceae bacterium]
LEDTFGESGFRRFIPGVLRHIAEPAAHPDNPSRFFSSGAVTI